MGAGPHRVAGRGIGVILPPGQRRVEGFPRFGTHFHRAPPTIPADPMIEIGGAVTEPIGLPLSERRPHGRAVRNYGPTICSAHAWFAQTTGAGAMQRISGQVMRVREQYRLQLRP